MGDPYGSLTRTTVCEGDACRQTPPYQPTLKLRHSGMGTNSNILHVASGGNQLDPSTDDPYGRTGLDPDWACPHHITSVHSTPRHPLHSSLPFTPFHTTPLHSIPHHITSLYSTSLTPLLTSLPFTPHRSTPFQSTPHHFPSLHSTSPTPLLTSLHSIPHHSILPFLCFHRVPALRRVIAMRLLCDCYVIAR